MFSTKAVKGLPLERVIRNSSNESSCSTDVGPNFSRKAWSQSLQNSSFVSPCLASPSRQSSGDCCGSVSASDRPRNFPNHFAAMAATFNQNWSLETNEIYSHPCSPYTRKWALYKPCYRSITGRLCRLNLQRSRRNMLAAQQFHHLVKETRAHFMAFMCAGDIAHDHIYSQSCGPHHDGRRGSKSLSHMKWHGALPLLLRQLDVGLCLRHHGLMHRFGNWIRINAGGNWHLNLIPQPLSRGGKIKVVAFNGKAVYHRHLAARRVACI